MGFRNPITTAAAVDTGLPGDPSVYLTKGNDGQGNSTSSYGVVGFRDGFPNDSDGTIVRRAVINTRSQVASGGGSLTIDPGSFAGTAGPKLALRVDSDGAGGFLRRIVADVALDPLVPLTRLTLPFSGTGTFQPYGGIDKPITIYGGGGWPTAVKLASGAVVVTGMVTAVNLSFGIGATVATLPAGCAPTQLRRFVLQGWGAGGWIAEVSPTGAITYAGALAGSSPAAGSFLSFAGLTFDTL